MAEVPQSRNDARVLVVEDEDSIALALEYLLTRQGYRHERLNTGAKALNRITDSLPDLVILDVMLPEVSGYEICKQIRTNPDLSATRILMMTARGSARERICALDAGADGFVAKPFEIREFLAEVERVLLSGAA
jgi:DNA-binding response OmpR family regulator